MQFLLQEFPASFNGDGSRVRQVTNTYGNGQLYLPNTAYHPIDINNPMNGVNGNGYSNQQNIGGGTNFARQAFVNIPRNGQSQFLNNHRFGQPNGNVYYENNQVNFCILITSS